MYLTIIILPLLSSIVSGFFGRKVGVTGSHLIACVSVVLTTILSVISFLEVGINNISVYIKLFTWIDSESLNVSWGFVFDSLTVSMLIPVLIVSSLVHIYSIGYMSHDPHNQRFFSYLSLFTFMMIILVTSNNYLLMFVGWEGVGVCSYLLVSFWFTRIAANQSSISAFLTNRVGDCFLTIGMFAILWSFGNIDYSTVFSIAPLMNENIITIIGICLLIGAMAKSSQVGLHVWLPMAMEGPTPVSALIHAATMVTAGVYLLMRSSPLIEYSNTVLLLCLWIGAITTVFSSLIGLFQQDIKKVIAYSTMSQLGMMVVAIGLSSYNVALFHLVNHAFYKALLFLGAGAVIHAVSDNQDFRKYGGLKAFLPLTYSVMLIASLSLVAFPFMTGFYSKDFILESAYGQFYFSSTVVYFISTIGAMFTTLYSVKVLYLTFLTNPNGPIVNYKHAHEGDIFMSMPLIILAVFSIFFGYVTKDMFIGLGSNFFQDNSLFIHPSHEIMLDTEFAVPTFFKILPLIFTISLSIISIIISEFTPKALINFKLSRFGYNIFSFFNQRFLIEMFYNRYVTDLVLKLGGQTTKVLDKGSIELVGPFGLEKALLNLSTNISKLDTGVITSYALYILVGLTFYIVLPLFYELDNSLLLIILFALVTIKKSIPCIIKSYLSGNIKYVNHCGVSCTTKHINCYKYNCNKRYMQGYKLYKFSYRAFSTTVSHSNNSSFNISRRNLSLNSFNGKFTYKVLIEEAGYIHITVSLGYLLGITIPYYSEAAGFENSLADYFYYTLSGPFIIKFNYMGSEVHSLYIYEGFDLSGLVDRIHSELWDFHFSDEDYVRILNPDIELIFIRFPADKNNVSNNIIDSYDHVDCTTVSENQAYKQSLIDILEYDKKSQKKKNKLKLWYYLQ
uniref:NADH-ubiquinone oxidoreductase chain 5 n=1 Tax=Zymoseptoria tritici (strain CBS 115943 / IPO323) TaxID=336722 RepID=A9Y5H2_ZYMTI|nr:NADH dehydrogenase subunit 5 [Zymoseptoria tritici]ABU40259.1 NADH dehydrogenase subunit 5 [Zymoseptoria tritici]